MRVHQNRALFFFLLLQFALKNSSLILKMQIHRARSHASRYRFEKFGNRFRRVISIWVQIERSKWKSKSVPATYSFENTQTNFARIYYFSPRDALFWKQYTKEALRRWTIAKTDCSECLDYLCIRISRVKYILMRFSYSPSISLINLKQREEVVVLKRANLVFPQLRREQTKSERRRGRWRPMRIPQMVIN